MVCHPGSGFPRNRPCWRAAARSSKRFPLALIRSPLFQCGPSWQCALQRLQHLYGLFIRFPEAAFRETGSDEPLYHGSPSGFRRRCGKLLALLYGGLWGGGAIKSYKAGLSIQDLMWRMRLRSPATLESYLRKVAAISVFPGLPRTGRDQVAAAGTFYQPATAAFVDSGGLRFLS